MERLGRRRDDGAHVVGDDRVAAARRGSDGGGARAVRARGGSDGGDEPGAPHRSPPDVLTRVPPRFRSGGSTPSRWWTKKSNRFRSPYAPPEPCFAPGM